MTKEYFCSNCGYSSDIKNHVEKHIKKKSGCGEKPTLQIRNVAITCKYCEKCFNSKRSLKEHIKKSCKILKKDEAERLRKENEELKLKLAVSEAKPQTVNNIVINVNVNGYRQTSFDHLTDRHYKRAISRMIYSVPQMIENVHFDPKVPENHNIYISNIKNKYAMVYDGEKWCSKPQDNVIDQLINDQEYAIEEWLGEGDNFPKEMKKFNDYLSKKDHSAKSDEIKEVIKEEVKLLLYNNRNKIKRS